MEEPKDPEICNVYRLYKLFASVEQSETLAARYRAGGLGWGHAKAELQAILEERFGAARERYNALLSDTTQIDKILAYGASKARPVARELILKVRESIGIPESSL
jgi:tryptophanyl-tRNA synthetase